MRRQVPTPDATGPIQPAWLHMPTTLGYRNPQHIQAIFATNTCPGAYRKDQGYNWFGGS